MESCRDVESVVWRKFSARERGLDMDIKHVILSCLLCNSQDLRQIQAWSLFHALSWLEERLVCALFIMGMQIFVTLLLEFVFLFWQAAPGYYMAKLIIKLFNSIAKGGNMLKNMELFIPLSVRYQRNNACLSFDTRYFHFVCVRLLFFLTSKNTAYGCLKWEEMTLLT